LYEDFTSKVLLKSKQNAGQVGVTIETEQVAKGALAPKISLKFNQGNFSVDKAQITADGGRVFESSLKLSPDVKLYFKASKGADLLVDYQKGNFFATGSVDVMELSNITSSACVDVGSGIKVGGDVRYNLGTSRSLAGFSIGASYSSGPVLASLTSSKFEKYNLGLLYKVNGDLSIASQTIHSSSKPFDVVAIGAAYKAPFGLVKAKVGSTGIISACVTREIAPKVSLTASGAVSANDLSTFKPGLSINI
jgi:voltage-dependent anion channel protein 2